MTMGTSVAYGVALDDRARLSLGSSHEAIYRMVRRGILQRGVHYFQPQGARTQLIFKWSAIVTMIESGGSEVGSHARPSGGTLDVKEASQRLRRLLGGFAERSASAPLPLGQQAAVVRNPAR